MRRDRNGPGHWWICLAGAVGKSGKAEGEEQWRQRGTNARRSSRANSSNAPPKATTSSFSEAWAR
eukprot:gene12301-biopygen556